MHYSPDLDLRSQLQQAIAVERDELVRCRLEFAVEGLDGAIRDFCLHSHGDNLTVLQGAWSNAVRILDSAGAQTPQAA